MKKQFKLTLAIVGLSACGFAVAGINNSVSLDDLTVNAAEQEPVSACVVQPNSDCHSSATGNIYVGRTLASTEEPDPGEGEGPIMNAE